MWRSSRWPCIALAVAAGPWCTGCGGNESDSASSSPAEPFCDATCSCDPSDCTAETRSQCVEFIENQRVLAGSAGCLSQYDGYLQCRVDTGRCVGDELDDGQCDQGDATFTHCY